MWLKVLFTTKGRIGRRTYAVGLLINLVLAWIAYRALRFVIIPTIESTTTDPEVTGGLEIACIGVSILVLIWIYMVLTLKRLHDIGKGLDAMHVHCMLGIGSVIQTGILLRPRACGDPWVNKYGGRPKRIGQIGPMRLVAPDRQLSQPKRIGYDKPPLLIAKRNSA